MTAPRRGSAERGTYLAGFHRSTRFSASVLGAMAISDFLQVAYKAAEERGLGGRD